MTAKDFISTIQIDLQENHSYEKFWDDPQLFIKVQRAYKTIQQDLPYFISKEELLIEEGNIEYYLKHEALENVNLKIDSIEYMYCDNDNLHKYEDNYFYTIERKNIILAKVPKNDMQGLVRYKYGKTLDTQNDEIVLPSKYEEPLRLLVFSYVFEKNKGNSKQRDLSIHYLNRYNNQISKIKKNKKRAKGIRSRYQKV